MSLGLESWTGTLGEVRRAIPWPVATVAWPDWRESGVCCARAWCGRDGLKYPAYSTNARTNCRLPSTIRWSRHSRRTLPTKRSQIAFARGASYGVWMTSNPQVQHPPDEAG